VWLAYRIEPDLISKQERAALPLLSHLRAREQFTNRKKGQDILEELQGQHVMDGCVVFWFFRVL
jgi:hypothetical protein